MATLYGVPDLPAIQLLEYLKRAGSISSSPRSRSGIFSYIAWFAANSTTVLNELTVPSAERVWRLNVIVPTKKREFDSADLYSLGLVRATDSIPVISREDP